MSSDPKPTRSRPVAVLAKVSAMLSSSLNRPELTQAVLSRVGELLDCEGAFLCEFDEASDALVFRGSYGLPEDVARTMANAPPLPRGRGSFSQLAESSAPLMVADLTADGAMRSPFLPWFVNAGYRAMLGVPLMREDRTMGGLVIFRRRAGGFSDDEVDLLSAFAAECALAMAHVRLFALLDERSNRLSLALAEQAASNEVLRVMAASRADSQPVFDTIARKAAELCGGDRSAVFSFDGQWINIRAHHLWSPEELATFQALYPRRPGDPSVAAVCVATREVVHVADAEAQGEASPVPQDSLSLTRQLSLRAILAVPMLRDGDPIGAIGVMRAQPGAFAERHIGVLKTFAEQAVVAVETSRLFHEVQLRNEEIARHRDRMEGELQLAREIQLGMVPTRFPPPGLARPVLIHALLEPAREIGGDLYDCFWRSDGKLCFVVADVSDKGAPAALYMARTKTLLRAMASLDTLPGSGVSPARVLNAVNEDLCIDNPHAMFVTVLLGILDAHSGEMLLANAGHPSPLTWQAASGGDGPADIRMLAGRRGPPLGVSTRSRYSDDRFQLGVGECLLAYTDGISEAADEQGALFGDERVIDVLRGEPRTSPRDLLDALMRAIKGHAGNAAQADDIALLALVRKPSVTQVTCLQLPHSLQAVEDAIEAVEALAQAHQVPMAAAHRLQLVLDEALSNVVNHGSSDDHLPNGAVDGTGTGQRGIRLWLTVTDRQWVVEIEDQGVAFDPTRVVLETPHGRLVDRQLGGLGLHFMRRLCTTMHYERDGGLNRLSLAVALEDTAAGA